MKTTPKNVPPLHPEPRFNSANLRACPLPIVDVYEMPDQTVTEPADIEDDDGAADERLAEQFRQQFLDDMAQRRKRKKPATQAAKPTEEVLKGPKLGGSRNVRAQVRDILLKKEKEGKK